MSARAIGIFPTVIYCNNLNPMINQLLLPEIEPYRFSSDQIQGEYLGLADMHLAESLSEFYQIISSEARIYIETLGINNDLFDLYFVKSTLSKLSTPDQHFVTHKHHCSDISFVYYVQVPPGSDTLYFLNEYKPNELFGYMFNHDRDRSMIANINAFNAITHNIDPEPGLLVLFPGKTPHGTRNLSDEPFSGERIAIVGDINLVLKPEHNNWDTGKVNLSNWRKFT